jgi:LDH2 family malate/lactate/ureidoglycolate dehydrogenase
MTIDVARLRDFCARALMASGLEEEKAKVTARVLVEGDLLGHSTHGTALLPQYCDALRANTMTHAGHHRVLNSRAAVELWDGIRLPGPWLVEQAIARAKELATSCGAGTIVIRHSHHIACLAAYLEAPARAGFVTQILSSDAAVAAVAPHGGRTPVMTPNPLAISWPTQAEPVIVDVSMSVTAMGLTKRLFEAKQPMPEGWAIDAAGAPTTDAGAIWNAPKGALLPLGSDIAGHKGYALGLMVEALTGGLAGYGRADFDKEWGATVQIQVWDPAAFSGFAAFSRETDFMRAACKASLPRPGVDSVRLPGERGLALKYKQLKEGLLLHESITPRLRQLATVLKINDF